MRIHTLPLLFRPAVPNQMGFSIGGWHPFSGGLVGILEGGTIDGHGVLSGGLAGVAKHLDQIAAGVTLGILGGTIGGPLNDLANALETPVNNLFSWIDNHKSAILTVVAIVGVVAAAIMLGPYAYAAWDAEVGDATLTTDMTVDLSLPDVAVDATAVDAAPAVAEGSSLAADATAGVGVATAEEGSEAISTVNFVDTTADLGPITQTAELPEAALTPDVIPTAMDPISTAPLIDSGSSYATTALDDAEAVTPIGTDAPGVLSDAGKAAAGAAAGVITKGLLPPTSGTVPGGASGGGTLPSTSNTASTLKNLPTWVWIAAGVAAVMLLSDGE